MAPMLLAQMQMKRIARPMTAANAGLLCRYQVHRKPRVPRMSPSSRPVKHSRSTTRKVCEP